MEKIIKIVLGIIGLMIGITLFLWIFDIKIPVYVLSFIGMMVLISSFVGIAYLVRKRIEKYEQKKTKTGDNMLEICRLVKEKWYKYTGEKILETGTMYVTHFFKKPYYGFVFDVVGGDRINSKLVIVVDDKGEFKKVAINPTQIDIKDPFYKFRTFCVGSPTPDVDLRMEPRARWDLPVSRGIEEETIRDKNIERIKKRTDDEIMNILGDLGIDEE